MATKRYWWLSLAVLAVLGGCANNDTDQAPASESAEQTVETETTTETSDAQQDSQGSETETTSQSTEGKSEEVEGTAVATSESETPSDFDDLPEGTQVALYADALAADGWIQSPEQSTENDLAIQFYKSDDNKIYMLTSEGPSRMQMMSYGVMTENGFVPIQRQGYDTMQGVAYGVSEAQPEQIEISEADLMARYDENPEAFDQAEAKVTATRDAYLSFISALYKGQFTMIVPEAESGQLTPGEMALTKYIEATKGGGYPHAEWTKDVALTVNDNIYGFLNTESGEAKRFSADESGVTNLETDQTKDAQTIMKSYSRYQPILRTLVTYAAILDELKQRMNEDWTGDGTVPPYFEEPDGQDFALTDEVAVNLVKNFQILGRGAVGQPMAFEIDQALSKPGEIAVTNGASTFIVDSNYTISTPDGEILHDGDYIGWKNFDIVDE